jgi:hypothetical protein
VSAAVETGRVLAGRYRLLARLGRGGFGEVWRANDAVLGREVAVKTLALPLADPSVEQRFEREARALARLDHLNVVAVYDSGVDLGTGYLVMQLLPGPSLAALLAEQGPLPLAQALGYAQGAAAGLAAAHGAGLVHRDVSPANLILDRGGTVKLVDFGVARLTDASPTLTATGTVFATPGYVSPEQAAGRPADARSDLYALGCVLYALLAGEAPFTAEHPLGVVHQHLSSPPPRLGGRRADVPAELDDLLASLLAKDPDERPASAERVRRRLAEISATLPAADTQPVATMPLPTAPTRPLERRRRGRWALAAVPIAAAAVIALAATLAVALTGHTRSPAPRGAAAGVRSTTTPATTAAKKRPTTTTTSGRPATATLASVETPDQALAAARAAIAHAQAERQIDPAAAADLGHRLDEIGKALQHPNPQDAAHKVVDLLNHLGDLAGAGRLTSAGLTQLMTPLDRLAALVPARASSAHGDHGHHGKGEKKDNP